MVMEGRISRAKSLKSLGLHLEALWRSCVDRRQVYKNGGNLRLVGRYVRSAITVGGMAENNSEEPLDDGVDEAKPSKGRVYWSGKFVAIAQRLAANGARNQDIAEEIGVSPGQLSRWIARHPALRKAIKLGRDVPDEIVERTLYERARGYDVVEQQAIKLVDTHVHEPSGKLEKTERVEVVEIVKHIPANTSAMIFWLSNRRPDKWRRTDKPDRDALPADLQNLTLAQMQQLLAGHVITVDGTVDRTAQDTVLDDDEDDGPSYRPLDS